MKIFFLQVGHNTVVKNENFKLTTMLIYIKDKIRPKNHQKLEKNGT
jgi:hypothetical protein